jgi:hypothetical protein
VQIASAQTLARRDIPIDEQPALRIDADEYASADHLGWIIGDRPILDDGEVVVEDASGISSLNNLLADLKAKTAIYPAPSSAASRPARTAAGPSERVKL